MENKLTFGLLVKTARKERGWTVKELIKRLGGGVSSAYMTKIEIHHEIPSPSFTWKLSEVLGIDLEVLVESAKESKRRMFEELLERKYEEVTHEYNK